MKQLQQIADRVDDQIRDFTLQLERTGVVDEGLYALIRQELDRVAAKDILEADGRRAYLAGISSKTDDFDAALRNLRGHNHRGRAVLEQFCYFINHGFASEAYALADEALAARYSRGIHSNSVLYSAVSLGAFRKVNTVLAAAHERDEVLHVVSLVKKLKEIILVADQIKVDDVEIIRMMDVAGEILREKKRLWAGDDTQITTLTENEDGPLLLIEYFVGVSSKEAAEMSWDLAGRLVDRDLYVPGVALSFIGVNA